MAMPPRGFLMRLLLVCHFLKSLLRFLIPKRLINSFLTTSPPVKGNPRTTTATAPPPPAAAAAKPTRPLPSPVALSAELERLFQTFDRNGDGRITREELTDSLESLGIFIPERDLEATIRKVDADGDGCLDADEFRELYAAIMTAREDGAEEEDDGIKEAFDVFDENGDGFITVEELRSVLGSLGLRQGRTAEDCRRMIGTVDADGDGRVDFQEFREMMRRGGPVAAF